MTSHVVVFCITYSILAVWFDWRTFRIPNRLIGFGYLAASLIQMLMSEGTAGERLIRLTSGALCPMILLGLVWMAGGIGAGDVKLLSVLGAVLGAEEIIVCSIISFMVGAVIGIIAKIAKRDKIHFSIAILVGIVIQFIQNGGIP